MFASNIKTLQLIVLNIVFLSATNMGQISSDSSAENSPLKSTSRISVKYDKSNDVTLVSLKSITITRYDQEKQLARNFPQHQMEFEAFYEFKGQTPKSEESVEKVTLRFRCVSNRYIFLRGQELVVALDREIKGKDRGFSLGNTQYKSLTPEFNTVFKEVMDITVPSDAVKKFSAAQMLEFFVGPIVYRLTDKQLDAIKEFGKPLDQL